MPHLQRRTTIIKVNDYTLITNSDKKPLKLEEVKDFLKISDSSSDIHLALLIDTVTKLAEQITGRDLLNKTYKGYLDCFPRDSVGIQIQKSKLQSITSIKFLVSGVLTAFDSSNFYITDKQEYAEIWLFDQKFFPTNADVNRKQAIEITFVAGYGADSCDIPPSLKTAMLAHINILNENRGDCEDESAFSNQIVQLYTPYIVSHKLFSAT